MNDKSKQTPEKLNGVFYTPKKIVDFLSKWAIKGNDKMSVLEPSAGDGRFVDKIKQLNDIADITAVEMNGEECRKISEIQDVNVINDDFYNFYEDIKDQNKKFDLVIGNPPYIRYQFLSEEQRQYQSDILERNGLRANKLINAWVAFTVAAIELTKEGGKFAFVLPSDILQVSYAKQLRNFIFEKLDYVNIVRFNDLVFEGIQQNILLLFGKKNSNNNGDVFIRNINIKDLSELPSDLENIKYQKYSFDNSDKWRKLLLEEEALSFYNKEFIEKTEAFNKYAKVEVGITTGNNRVFSVPSEVVKRYDLSDYTIPLLGRSVDANGIFYKDEDLKTNDEKSKNVWILDFNNKNLTDGAKEYINYIESIGEHEGYKLSIRDKWYEVPSIWIPDAFILRRMGGYPKLVKNELSATSTDTFHRVVFADNVNPYKLMVLFYSSITLLTFELEGRVFGGGALEILPGDIKNIRVAKIKEDLDYKSITKEIDKMFRENVNILDIVKLVDEKIQPYTSLTIKEMELIFDSWVKMKNMRVNG